MRLRHWTIPLLYAAGATVWIFATDGVVDALSTDKDTLQSLQLLKGLLFVVLSAALLALFVQRERRAREALERHVDEQRVLTQLVQRCEDLSRSATTTRALTQAVCEAVREVEGIDSVLVRIGMGSDRMYPGAAGATEDQLRKDLATITASAEGARAFQALLDRGERFHTTTAALGITLPGVEALLLVALGRPAFGVLAVRAKTAAHFTAAWVHAIERVGLAVEAGLNRLEVRATLDTFLEKVPISVTVFDAEGRLRLVNAEARARAAEVASPPTLAQRFPESHEAFASIAAAHATVRRTNTPVLATHRINGRTYDATHVPLPDASGRVDSVAMLARDVTDEEALRTALRALTTESMQLREDEQARLSRDLHDDLGQRLTALKLQLRAIERVVSDLPSMPGGLVDRVVEASALADETVLDVQRISQALRPAALEALGLPAALRDEVAAFSRRSGVACTTSIDDLAVEPLVATQAFRIAQEALTNVARQVGGKLDLERRVGGGTVVRLTIGGHP